MWPAVGHDLDLRGWGWQSTALPVPARGHQGPGRSGPGLHQALDNALAEGLSHLESDGKICRTKPSASKARGSTPGIRERPEISAATSRPCAIGADSRSSPAMSGPTTSTTWMPPASTSCPRRTRTPGNCRSWPTLGQDAAHRVIVPFAAPAGGPGIVGRSWRRWRGRPPGSGRVAGLRRW
jgi:hypothetical protein